MALTFTQEHLDALQEALLTGALEVQIGDRTVKYRSQDDILRLINIIEQHLAGTTSSSDNPRMIQAGFSRDGE